MMSSNLIEKIGLVAAVVMPFFNIPLILRITKRKSSKDISLFWVLGVWTCIILMAPSAFVSTDIVWRSFNSVNLVMFTAVMITVLKYRRNV